MKRKAIIYAENTEKLVNFTNYLVQNDWELFSGGDAATFLSENSVPFTYEQSLSSSPKGRVAFLSMLDDVVTAKNEDAVTENDNYDDVPYSLLCVNVVPLYKKVSDLLENSSVNNPIDFKHILLIRAAAKNFQNVLILTDPEDYKEAMIQLRTDNITEEFRLYLAGKALNLTAAYDASCSNSIIFSANNVDFPNYLVIPYKREKMLSQGSNAHQKAYLYSQGLKSSALYGIKKIQGKESNYNLIKNYFHAWKIVSRLLKNIKNPYEVPSVDCSGYSYFTQFTPAAGLVFTVALKYGNPIGAALADDVRGAFLKMYNRVPDEFHGACIGCSAVIDENAADLFVKLDILAIIAPDFTEEARKILSENKDLRLIMASNPISESYELQSIDGGLLAQSTDRTLFEKWKVVTKRRPTQAQIDALAFGALINCFTKSDSVVIVNEYLIIGISSALATRKNAIDCAVYDARMSFKKQITSPSTDAEILICDTSIPFSESLQTVADIGVKAILQSGGSSTDDKVIAFCDEHDIAMVFTGMEHIAF